jgi:hypothetical protein
VAIKKDKIKKPKGGCPFMPSDNKKNPPLQAMSEGYDTNFISPHDYLLSPHGLFHSNFTSKVFDSYPIYLKHTIIHDEENMKKVRKLEVAQRFFIYDKFREKGNKEYYKGNFVVA